jgi:hypothetical protein
MKHWSKQTEFCIQLDRIISYTFYIKYKLYKSKSKAWRQYENLRFYQNLY